MKSLLGLALGLVPWHRADRTPWTDTVPIREELFGLDRLEQHAETLAAAQPVTTRPPRVVPLHTRLDADAVVLLATYRASAAELEAGRSVVPAAEWLLDNYHLVERQIREIHDDLPPGYYKQLPKLAEGPFAGYPRVFGLAWAYVAHTDSLFDPESLRRFIAAYQRIQPLTIGELWAVAITLRIVLIENLRRLADQITAERRANAEADALADRLLSLGAARTALDADKSTRSTDPLSELFATQLAKRLRGQDPRTTPALGWLVDRLRLQDSTVDEVVEYAQQRQGTANVTVRNIVTSMRLMNDIDWADLFESVSLIDERMRAQSNFAGMDFPTRNLYRSAIEQLARGSDASELEITDHALEAARLSIGTAADTADAERVGDPGYHLIAEGRRALERTIAFRPPLGMRISRFDVGLGIGGYVGAIALTAILLEAGALWMLGLPRDPWWAAAAVAVGLLPAVEVATGLVDRVVTRCFGAAALPGLDLRNGVPPSLRTLVAVPILLAGEDDLLAEVERLEVHFLSGNGGDLTFALLSDGVDAATEVLDADGPLLATASAAIDALNSRHGPGPDGDRFLLLHRRRIFDAGENCWMGWERKRGKLHELNRLLRGADDTTFVTVAGRAPRVPSDVRYVLTLDADTRLPRDTAQRLIGKMAHPLNRPRFDAARGRVVDGHAILQPRVTPSLPVGHQGSLYQRVFSAPGGIDPYSAAVSDVYQDLFGEGSFTGKGIYDVDAFEAALAGRVPDDTLLSHDLFEGVFARAGLASDVEVIEEFPARYDVAAKRQHRWTRGDWQLLPWIFRRRGVTPVPPVGTWKMVDNLRRSVTAPAILAALICAWMLPLAAVPLGIALVLAAIVVPAFVPVVFAVVPPRSGIGLRSHLGKLRGDLRLAALQTVLSIVFLPDRAWHMGDAVVRTLYRLSVSRRHLLEWTTAAKTSAGPRLELAGSYRRMIGGTVLGVGLAGMAMVLSPAVSPFVLPFVVSWALAPAVAVWVSRSPVIGRGVSVPATDAAALRLVARRTWRFFETFVTAEDNWLPPDNFQEAPHPVVAHRTSPTNIGLYLLSAITARDFGWAGTTETVERLEATLGTMRRLTLFKGHLFNWYGTLELQVLDPPYVSSVDSGNLAGHLIAVANTCEEWMSRPEASGIRDGLGDELALARAAVQALPVTSHDRANRLAEVLYEIETQLTGELSIQTLTPVLRRLTEKAARIAHGIVPIEGDDSAEDLVFWIGTLGRTVSEHDRDRGALPSGAHALVSRLKRVADTAREMALAMDFAFLLDPERKLLSIGYSLSENGLDPSCYDLLASEARLASLFAIAKGDVATRHWFRLGRSATPLGDGSALISWSGSMFEYLMPSLVMRAAVGSLLEQTNRLVVERQESYGRSLGVPWGISESAYNARDLEFTYQYSNFGVPGLGLKRGLSDNVVIAPYATGLAAMVDPLGACANFTRLAALGGLGRFGFYEALDFTPARLPEDATVAIVRSFMAHHQGMTIVAIANALMNGLMRARFHREPIIQATELLLQERMPRDVVLALPRAEEVKAHVAGDPVDRPTERRLVPATLGEQATHLLSNGRYAVMLTASGAGYSRWHDIAITRWREDATRDDWGSWIFLHDTRSGIDWSVGSHSHVGAADFEEVVFGEDHAEFVRRDGTLTTTMDVLVSGETDGEVRRVSLTNSGRRPREIEITSYAELVLTSPAADAAHPAFAKMFVETEHLAEYDALIATRRPRTPDEPPIWVAHFAVVEGKLVADPQYESDRARFVGRGRRVATARAVGPGGELSGTVGTVLDPIFSLRRRVRIAPGKVARIAFWTLVARSRAELLDLVDKHHDRNAYDRAKTLAWTQAQVQLRHLDVSVAEAADFQRLAAPLLYADRRFRASSEALVRGAGPQSGLWAQSISGDQPIVLLRIDDVEDIAQVSQLLRAHEYWRMKQLAVDLVIMNEHPPSYAQELQNAIETAVRSSQSRPRLGSTPARGTVHALRADLLDVATRALIQSVARIELIARRGGFADQLAHLPRTRVSTTVRLPAPSTPGGGAHVPIPRDLEFFNGTGGFASDGREYVTVLGDGRTTPAPWINVIANPTFGFHASAEGSGYTWAENSRENQLTPWSNDPVVDPAGEAFYVRDEATGELSSPTALPIRDDGTYVARHGAGFSRFQHEADGLSLDLLQYVPLGDPIKISRLTIRNTTGRRRHLTVTAFAEWVLGTSRGASAPFIVTGLDAETGALVARNPWSTAFPGRVAFADLGGRHTSWTGDRTEFIGRRGDLSAPAALSGPTRLTGTVGAGYDPCAALRCPIELGVDESIEVVAFLGQCPNADAVSGLITRYRTLDLDMVLAEVVDHWSKRLGAVRVATPDRSMDIMLNGWLLYQTLACRVWARSAFYQASGAYGFRDQLQDGMASTFARPAETRAHLLRAAGRQFVEGDVQHWWLPGSGVGVRTRISDDRVWLAFAVATYVVTSGDTSVLDEVVPFLDGPRLQEGQHEAFFQPMQAEQSRSLWEHCALGLDQCIQMTGTLGLPLMGSGDWNDGMNRVGEAGRGESVWLGWLLIRTIALMAPLGEARDPERTAHWRLHAIAVREAIEREAWDGEWYRRATYDDGTWLGSAASDECRIDSIAQTWAVLSGAGDPARAATAMASLDRILIDRDARIARLFTPPFDQTGHDPGYIKGYPPGLRENGGQYSHAAMWAVLAFAAQGRGDRATELFAMLNPINHALTPEAIDRYKVEPYVVAADVYSVAPHVGRGGWTWYTGSAGWMYRAGIEGILGIRREGARLIVDPCIPMSWPGFRATIEVEGTHYDLRVTSSGERCRGLVTAVLDGASAEIVDGRVAVPLDGATHELTVSL